MPTKPLHMCNATGCRVLVTAKYCPKHAAEKQEKSLGKRRAYDKDRPAYYGWYDLARWKLIREKVLYAFPFCVDCDRAGRTAMSTIVDHVVPHKGDSGLFWDLENLQGLCAHCHSVKTSKEDSWNNNRK
jgi:5-methylcytosine-specific restriction protein A